MVFVDLVGPCKDNIQKHCLFTLKIIDPETQPQPQFIVFHNGSIGEFKHYLKKSLTIMALSQTHDKSQPSIHKQMQ
jgi:hypothetical protein